MIEITLDASQLEVFEPCPRKWYYSYHQNLIPQGARRAFDKGSYYHEVLAYYYKNKLNLRSALDFAAQAELLAQFKITDVEEIRFHRKRLVEYFTRYEDEDQNFKIIAIEEGFTRLLYEDSAVRFILEGKIDFVAEGSPYGLFVMDHKTQARKDDRWEFNHQVCNYLTFTKANYFIYNYIGLQESLPKEGMRRVIYKPPPGMLEQWEKEVLRSFHEIASFKVIHPTWGDCTLENDFPRKRSACDSSKYGLCPFHKLCSVPDGSKWVTVIRSAYKQKEAWKAWS